MHHFSSPKPSSRQEPAPHQRLRECVRAVDNRLDAARPRQACDVAHWKQLAGQVRDVADVDHLGLRGDSLAEERDVVLRPLRIADREDDSLDDDAAAVT